MRRADFLELLTLAALWGASFLFIRVAAPPFGPVVLIALRLAIASCFLVPLLAMRGKLGALRLHWPAGLLLPDDRDLTAADRVKYGLWLAATALIVLRTARRAGPAPAASRR